MVIKTVKTEVRFPWGYFVASLLPIGLIAGIHIVPAVLGSIEGMGWAMLSSVLIGPVGAVVVAWGIIRLWQGDGQRFPALRWLVWLPLLSGIIGIALG
ncbi:MAG: hypothetical protein WKF77_06395 [Planctomycetaceae bacterium]